MMATTNLIALDVGEKRVGVAIASHVARLPRPLTTLLRGDNFWNQLQTTLKQEVADILVIGLPRNLDGQETAQSAIVRSFVEELKQHTDLPIVFQDETLSSHAARTQLEARGKPFTKGDIDAMAAMLILEDYLNQPSN